MTTATLRKSINASQALEPNKELMRAVLSSLTSLRNAVGPLLTGSATYDPASLVDAAGATTTVTVAGAALGDFAFASFGVDLQGILLTAYVSAVDTVSVRFQNETASTPGTVDLVSSTLTARVIPQAVMNTVMGVLSGQATYDLASLVDAAGATTTVTVTGAALGDFAFVSHGVDLQGILLTGYVSAADTVAVRFQNETAGTLDLASSTLRARVIPKADWPTALGGFLFGSATYDAASLVDAAGTTTTVTVTGAQMGDFAIVSLGVDLAGITVSAYVSAENTVSVRLQNESGGTLDLASTTLRAIVFTPAKTSVAPRIDLAA